jgi:predicted amidohydrolase
LKVGYVQNSPKFGEKRANYNEIEDYFKNVKAELIVLPELFATGYTFVSKEEAESLAEDWFGETAEFLVKLAQLTSSVVVGGFIEKERGKIYNAAMIVSGEGVIDSYRKIHLYFKEKLWFSPGNKPLKVYELNGFKVGIMIC